MKCKFNLDDDYALIVSAASTEEDENGNEITEKESKYHDIRQD